jgi:hypothetical protein
MSPSKISKDLSGLRETVFSGHCHCCFEDDRSVADDLEVIGVLLRR